VSRENASRIQISTYKAIHSSRVAANTFVTSLGIQNRIRILKLRGRIHLITFLAVTGEREGIFSSKHGCQVLHTKLEKQPSNPRPIILLYLILK
jgi:hypothetical protein